MNAIINFDFEDRLVRICDLKGDPWFVGRDICDALGIKNHRTTLDLLDDDEKGVHSMDTLGGQQDAIIVSEPGVYQLVFRSRKPEAKRFRRWLAHEVLPQIRKTGRYAVSSESAEPFTIESSAVAAMRTRIDLVKEARALFGPARAATLWGKLGLPAVPPPPPTGIAEAEACLRYLLNWVPDGLENGSIRQNIEIALQDDEECRIAMRAHGIRVSPDMNEEGFIVSNRSSSLVKHFANTEWANYRWYRVLRRLPDTTNIGPMKYDAPVAMRGTFIPASYLDENPQIVR